MAHYSVRALAIGLLGSVAALSATPALAANSAADYFRERAETSEVPQILSDADQAHYRDIFTAIALEDWSRVDELLEKSHDGLLQQVALAEYYTHAKSPKIDAEKIAVWLEMGTHLPQAEQLARLGEKRGLEYTPSLPQTQSFNRQSHASKRLRPRSVQDGTMPQDIRNEILEHIKNDDPDNARLLLEGIDELLSAEARAEWRQRVAWSYYIENNDPMALAMAQTVTEGAGAWLAEGEWVTGLAAWRMGDCDTAGRGFARAAELASNVELKTAGHFWAARALTRCRAPGAATEHLQAAARYDETFYGMLALEQLGQDIPTQYAGADFAPADWQRLRDEQNVRIVIALIEIGRSDLADEVIRHQARIGDPKEFAALSRLARELGLPQAQLWMAHNTPRGSDPVPALRYPTARWKPTTGWQVDPALAFALALQESVFRADAVSPANARGLMQITPITVREHAGRMNMSASYVNLDDPETNLAFGQRNLEMLRDSNATQGLLPKIMAAYNAGLSPVTRWNNEVRDQGDPLLYMESIPYWETRGYVNVVMRNYWMYERQSGAPSESRKALAQGLWPRFPESRGAGAVRLTGRN